MRDRRVVLCKVILLTISDRERIFRWGRTHRGGRLRRRVPPTSSSRVAECLTFAVRPGDHIPHRLHRIFGRDTPRTACETMTWCRLFPDGSSRGSREYKGQIRHLPTTCSLRAYQREALAAVLDAYKAGKRRVIVPLPTGTGKTVVFAHFPRVFKIEETITRARTSGGTVAAGTG